MLKRSFTFKLILKVVRMASDALSCLTCSKDILDVTLVWEELCRLYILICHFKSGAIFIVSCLIHQERIITFYESTRGLLCMCDIINLMWFCWKNTSCVLEHSIKMTVQYRCENTSVTDKHVCSTRSFNIHLLHSHRPS